MVRYATVNQCKDIDDLKLFDLENYKYDKSQSNEDTLVFTRPAGFKLSEYKKASNKKKKGNSSSCSKKEGTKKRKAPAVEEAVKEEEKTDRATRKPRNKRTKTT